MRTLGSALLLAVLLAGCGEIPPAPSESPRTPPEETRQAPVQPAPLVLSPSPVAVTSLQAYKQEVARRIVAASNAVYADPHPEMFKSIVVLEILIDRAGGLRDVSVRRSNRFRDLERVAMDSVRRAAPFPPPTGIPTSADGSVRLLETFLFRDDGRFQVRSLVAGV